jgi:hypothetical protein
MISQPQVEPANNTGARTMLFLSSCPARSAVAGQAAVPHPLLIAPRTKPGAVIRPGLGTLLKGISLYMNPVSRSRSRKLQVASSIISIHGAQRAYGLPRAEEKAGRG